jgi:cobalt-zinc-cadmium efflux system protein
MQVHADTHQHHGPHGHAVPAPESAGDRRRLGLALGLIVAFMVVEVTAGVLASSLALLSDAAHMLTDAAALGLALVAAGLASRPARGDFTFGLRRSEILSAQANGAMLGVLALFIVYGGVRRLVSPPAVDGVAVLVVALAGVAVNLAATRAVRGSGPRSLNIEGAYQHLLTDLAAFILTAAAGGVIVLTGFREADGIAALLVAAIMLYAAYGLLRESGRVLMEGSPASVDPQEIGRALAGQAGVVEVHDLHVWELTTNFPSLSAHVVVGSEIDCHATRAKLEVLLSERFGISHTTLQVEHEPRRLLKLE